jgi:hypothetical protein
MTARLRRERCCSVAFVLGCRSCALLDDSADVVVAGERDFVWWRFLRAGAVRAR